jgi:hypothetical protein
LRVRGEAKYLTAKYFWNNVFVTEEDLFGKSAMAAVRRVVAVVENFHEWV